VDQCVSKNKENLCTLNLKGKSGSSSSLFRRIIASNIFRKHWTLFFDRRTESGIIVVDDGSTDNTEKFINPIPHPVIYIKKENQGVAEARNTGIRLQHRIF